MLKLHIESIITPWTRMHRNNYDTFEGHTQLEGYEIGEKYSDFHMIEEFISDYDVDLTQVKVGDILVRDFQFGHLRNTGYTPLKVVETFNGMSIKVQGTDNRIYSICADPHISKDTVFHKLDKNSLMK